MNNTIRTEYNFSNITCKLQDSCTDMRTGIGNIGGSFMADTNKSEICLITTANALAKLEAVVAIVIESLRPAAAEATAAAAAAAALLLPLPELLVLLLTAATADRLNDEGSMNTNELPEATLNPIY